jgi:hypothetical protein
MAAVDIQATFKFVPQFVRESNIHQSCSVNSPVTKLLKVHWYVWYAHITSRIPKMKSPWVSDWVMWVDGMYPPWPIHSPGNFGSVPRHIVVAVERDPVLLPNHAVCIQRGIRKSSGMLRYTWHVMVVLSANLCSAFRIENIHLRTVSHMFGNLVRILWSPDD